MRYETIDVELQQSVCSIRINRPQLGNTIDDLLVSECASALSACEESTNVVVFSGLPDVFCFGADFRAIADAARTPGQKPAIDPDPLYDLWLKMAAGPFVTISHVRGKAKAGGVGFVAASDIVIADEKAEFSLSELLFGVYPACVLPFLVRRIGHQKAHYLTLLTQPINVARACDWGLVDAFEANSDGLLRRHIQRLRHLSKPAIRRYKAYMREIGAPLGDFKAAAVAANIEMFSDPHNVRGIVAYVERGVFPWES